MKSTTILGALALLITPSFSQPHSPHLVKHQHQHKARDVVWITQLAYETETVDITTTVWITEGSEPVTSSPADTTSANDAGEFFQSATSSTKSAVVVPTSTTAAIVQAPVTSESTIATTSSTEVASSAVYVPQETPTTAAAAVQATTLVSTTSSTPATSAAAVVASTQASTSTTTSSDTSAIDTSALTSGTECVNVECAGDLTYYTAALGACGYTTDGTTVLGVALPHDFMGTASNSNPYCNMTLDVTYGTTIVQATVIDKCMGCTAESIDLTEALFGSLGIDVTLGRVTGSWKFTGPQTTEVLKSATTYNFDN
jgi:hypothetical protein